MSDSQNMQGLTQSERATYQAMRARGYSEEDSRGDALDGVHVDDVRKPLTLRCRCVGGPHGGYTCPECR